MKIKDKLYASSAITLIVVVILLSTVAIASNRLSNENKKHTRLMDINRGVFELNIVTYEYLLHHEERMLVQWNSRYTSLEELLEEESVKSLRADYIALGGLFRQLTETYEKRQKIIQEGASQEEIDANLALEERLVAQLLIKSQDISLFTSKLTSELEDSINKIQERTRELLIVLMTLLLTAVVVNSYQIIRSTAEPIKKLIEGTEIIGRGNLEHKIDVKSTDEIGELAVAFNEMTEKRKKAEEELLVSNKELEAFSYSVSHDLRAPLRAINGFSNAVLEDYASKLDSNGQRYLKLIEENANFMGQLIDDLLTFSRLGRREITQSNINMEKLAKTTFEEIKSGFPDRKLRLKVGKLPPAKGDQSMIHRVFANLIDNAIKFTGPKEKAVIEVGGGCGEGDQNVYYVKDNGVGFDMKYIDKLFVVFQRLHSREDFEGTGVGLALVKRIIHKHGGRVWAEGKVNGGATFYFTLPQK